MQQPYIPPAPKVATTVRLTEDHWEQAELLGQFEGQPSRAAGVRIAMDLVGALIGLFGVEALQRVHALQRAGFDPTEALNHAGFSASPPTIKNETEPVANRERTGGEPVKSNKSLDAPIYTRAPAHARAPSLPHSLHISNSEGGDLRRARARSTELETEVATESVGTEELPPETWEGLEEEDRATPERLIELWNGRVEATKLIFKQRNEQLGKENIKSHYWVMPKQVYDCTMTRRRLRPAIARMPRLDDWRLALDHYENLRPEAVNGIRLADLDRLCMRPKPENENDEYRPLAVHERPFFIERLIDYQTWGVPELQRARAERQRGSIPAPPAIPENLTPPKPGPEHEEEERWVRRKWVPPSERDQGQEETAAKSRIDESLRRQLAPPKSAKDAARAELRQNIAKLTDPEVRRRTYIACGFEVDSDGNEGYGPDSGLENHRGAHADPDSNSSTDVASGGGGTEFAGRPNSFAGQDQHG